MSTGLSRILSRVSRAFRPPPPPVGTARMAISPEWMESFRPDDQFLVSYPRSGNTWLRHLLRELISLRRPDLPPPENLLEVLPTVHHMLPIAQRHEEFSLNTRLIKSHNIADLGDARMVYLFREPADALVSYYHQHVLRASRGKRPPPAKPLDEYCAGLIPDWCEHVGIAIRQREKSADRVHFAAYETLQTDTAGTFRAIVNFLGLAATEEQLAGAVERCSFAQLQTREKERKGGAQENLFFRKGRVGGGAEELQASTTQAIEAAARPLYLRSCELAAPLR